MNEIERRKHTPDPGSVIMALVGGFIASGLICILGFVTWALVYRAIPDANANAFTLLIGILSTNVGTLVGFYFGASYANNKKEQANASAMETVAKTAQAAQAALAPLVSPSEGITLAPGQTATATATEDGTTITPDAKI